MPCPALAHPSRPSRPRQAPPPPARKPKKGDPPPPPPPKNASVQYVEDEDTVLWDARLFDVVETGRAPLGNQRTMLRTHRIEAP